MFDTLSDRLAATFKNLRGKGKLTDADIDATAREIRIALLEADVALPVVREFIAAVKERAAGAEVLGVSLVTNLAAGMTGQPLSHVEVLEAGRQSATRMGSLLADVLARL